MSRALVATDDGEIHCVEIIAVGLNWWIGACRGCGAQVEARTTGRNARHFSFDGSAIRLGRPGVQVWPGHSMELYR